MSEFTFSGDGVEAHGDVVQPADDLQVVETEEVGFDKGGDGEDSGAHASEDLEESIVVELTTDGGAEFLGSEKLIEGFAVAGVFHGQEHGGCVEGAGEVSPILSCEVRGGEKGGSALPEEMVVSADLDGGGDGGVGEDHVDLVDGEVGEEVVHVVFAADDLDGFGEGEDGREEPADDEFGEDVVDSDGELPWPLGGSGVDEVDEFLAEGEDFIGVLVDGASHFGEVEVSSAAFEEFVSDGPFESSDLGGDGRLGEEEFFGRPDDGAFACDGPEVQQVVVVEPFHGGRYLSFLYILAPKYL